MSSSKISLQIFELVPLAACLKNALIFSGDLNMLSNFFAWQLNCVAQNFEKSFLVRQGLKIKIKRNLKIWLHWKASVECT